MSEHTPGPTDEEIAAMETDDEIDLRIGAELHRRREEELEKRRRQDYERLKAERAKVRP